MELLGQPDAGALPPKPGEEDGPKKGPGRPPADPTKRAINDERYRQAVDLIETLPDDAKQARFAVFRANRRTEQKKSFRPLKKIMLNEWREKNFQNADTLRAWLKEYLGPGGYVLEPYDEHNRRMDKVAAWFVNTNPEDDMPYDPEDDDDDDLDDEPRGRRFRRRYRDDTSDDGYLEERANVSDVLATATRAHSAQAMQANQSKDSLVSMMLLTQTQNAQAKQDEERRRDERAADERRYERERADKKEREDKEAAERRERLDREDRERKDKEEERRRQDERDERNRIEQRNRDEDARRAQSDAKRTEIIVAAVSALAPMIIGLMKREPTPPPQADPMAMILLKSIVDKTDKADSSQVMFTQMGEMAKLQTTIMSEQMRSSMNMSSEMNSTVMKKAMEMMMASPQGQSPEGKSMIEQIMMAVQGASELVKTLAPPPPAVTVQQQHLLPMQDQNPNRRFARAPQAPDPTQQQQAPAAPVAPPAPEQAPEGVAGVMHALRGIHTKAWSTNEEYQTFLQYLFQQMPLALRVAVLDGNDIDIYKLTKPAMDRDPVLHTWAHSPEALPWMRQFIPTLKPSIEQMFGAADDQRNQLRYLLSQGQQGHALALATPAQFQAYIEQQQKEQPQQPEAPAASAPAAPVAPDAAVAPVDGAAAPAPVVEPVLEPVAPAVVVDAPVADAPPVAPAPIASHLSGDAEDPV